MRRRFTRVERDALTVGTTVQWRNGRHWHPGVIAGPITTDDGWDGISVRHTGPTTATINRDAVIQVGPAYIRIT